MQVCQRWRIYSWVAIARVELTSASTSQFEEVLATMGVPFPELTDPWFSTYRTAPDVPAIVGAYPPGNESGPDSFLGGYAPAIAMPLYLVLHLHRR